MTFDILTLGLAIAAAVLYADQKRRAAFSKFFSKAPIRRFEPVVQAPVDPLFEKFEEDPNIGKPLDLIHAYSGLTQDIITQNPFFHYGE